jgi:hypothetical protein
MLRSLILGAEEQSRTADTRIFSPLLYHLSYLGIMGIVGSLLLQCQASVFVTGRRLLWVRYARPIASSRHRASPEGCHRRTEGSLEEHRLLSGREDN